MPRKAGDAETSMFTRGRIIGMYEGGVPKMMISKKLNIDPKTIRKWILRFESHGENGLKSIPKPGAHRKTTAYEDVAIAQAVAVTPTISPQEINKMLGLNISAHTIRRRVRDAKVRSRQEKRENRLIKKKGKQTPQQNDVGNNVKKKGMGMKKSRKKKPLQQEMCMQQNQQQAPQQPQVQHMTMAVQHDGNSIKVELKHDMPPVAVPVMDNSMHHAHTQYMPKEVMPPEQHVQLAPQHQFQPPKQMPFYGFGTSTGYEFPRIWAPMTNVNVGTAYCEAPKITTYTGFGPTEVPQVTHSSVQTASFLTAAVSTAN